MDCHTVIAGQNGVGKSYILLMLLKMGIGKNFLKNLILAKDTSNDLVQFMLDHENTLCGIDEMNLYFSYKEHSDHDQIHLINQLELARSKRIGYIGCVRDPRKLTLNYRQGKMSLVIWVLDRFSSGGSYAALFAANPSVESPDKFGFSWISYDPVNFDDLRRAFEDLPSFLGYVKIPNAKTILTEEEIKQYKKEKEIAMSYANLNHLIKQYSKKKIDHRELYKNTEKLKTILGTEIVEKELSLIKLAKQTFV